MFLHKDRRQIPAFRFCLFTCSFTLQQNYFTKPLKTCDLNCNCLHKSLQCRSNVPKIRHKLPLFRSYTECILLHCGMTTRSSIITMHICRFMKRPPTDPFELETRKTQNTTTFTAVWLKFSTTMMPANSVMKRNSYENWLSWLGGISNNNRFVIKNYLSETIRVGCPVRSVTAHGGILLA